MKTVIQGDDYWFEEVSIIELLALVRNELTVSIAVGSAVATSSRAIFFHESLEKEGTTPRRPFPAQTCPIATPCYSYHVLLLFL